jgi:hypothetical protein
VASADDIVVFCRLQLSEADAEQLVGWIAWRTGRNQALAGDRETIERLHHVVVNWLDADQRKRLLRWMTARVEAGRSPVPP